MHAEVEGGVAVLTVVWLEMGVGVGVAVKVMWVMKAGSWCNRDGG